MADADPLRLAAWFAIVGFLAALATALVVQSRSRRRAESDLAGAEHLMRMATAAAGVGLWTHDLARGTYWSNAEHRAILAIGEAEVPDLGERLDLVHVEDRSSVARAIGGAMRRGGEFEVRHRIVVASGDVRWVASRGSVRLDRRGNPASVCGATTDVSASMRAALDAEAHRNQLAHLSRVAMLGQLSGSIAHELNQPLTAILSNAQAALRFTNAAPVDLDVVQEILRDIVADDQRAGEVIWRLRALFERGEAKSEPLDAAALIRDVIRMLRSELISRNVTLKLELMPNLPPVQGDLVQLQQVLLNLVLNACEAMASSQPAERALLIRSALGGASEGEVSIAVVDGGPGIAPERIEKVFEPFVSSKRLGIGLGLAISRSIVAAHGGRLWCTNNEGRGATFTFTIPCHPSPAGPVAHGPRPVEEVVAKRGVLT